MDSPYQALIWAIFLGIPTTYLLGCFLLERKDSHEGPIKDDNRFVVFPSDGHHQNVALFDWIRRIFFAYRVEGNIWYVEEESARSQLWTCPFCLSFWISIPATLINIFYLGNDRPLEIVISHLTTAVIAQCIYTWITRNNV